MDDYPHMFTLCVSCFYFGQDPYSTIMNIETRNVLMISIDALYDLKLSYSHEEAGTETWRRESFISFNRFVVNAYSGQLYGKT